MRSPLLAPLLLSAIAAPGSRQARQDLVLDRPVQGELTNDEAHVFTLDLPAGQFVYGEVEQRTVDVVLTILGPGGDRLGTFDQPSRGAELFEFTSAKAGVHRLEVRPFGGERGEFVARLLRCEPLGATKAARIDQILTRYAGRDRPGVVVAEVRGGEVVFEASYGMAHLEWGIPNSGRIKFDIGSTSKTFTAFAICFLARQGHLDLDADIRQVLPELPDLGATVTLRHLLTHTSGYRDAMDLVLLGGRMPEDEFDFEELFGVLRRQEELQDPPGTVHRYNNTGYQLLACVVERVTGSSLSRWLTENVFVPLGMRDTVARDARGLLIPNRAEGYIPNGAGGVRTAAQNAVTPGSSGVWSTVHDLARWMGNFESEALGGPELLESMATPFVLPGGAPNTYGLGLRIDEERGLRRIHHSGGAMAFRSWFAYYPELGAGFLLLSNTSEFHRGAVSAVAEALFGERMQPPRTAGPTAPATPLETEPEAGAAVAFDDLAGRYYSAELDALYELSVTAAGLQVRQRRLGTIALEPAGRDRFRAAWLFRELVVRRSEEGAPLGFEVSTPRNARVRFRRLPGDFGR